METRNKVVLFSIVAVAIVAVAGVSLCIQTGEDQQPSNNKTTSRIFVGVEAGPLANECFNKTQRCETADYILEGTVHKVELKQDMESGIHSYVQMTIEDYNKGEPLPTDELQINVTMRAPLDFTPYEGKKVRIYLRIWSEGDLRIMCQQYGVEEIKP